MTPPIYTKTGDQGTSGIGSIRLPKYSPIFDVLGSLDYLQVKLGTVMKTISIATSPEARDQLIEADKLLEQTQTILYEFSGILHRAPSLDVSEHEDVSEPEDISESEDVFESEDVSETQTSFFRGLVSTIFGPKEPKQIIDDMQMTFEKSNDLSLSASDPTETANREFATKCAILSDIISGCLIDMEQSIDAMTVDLPPLRNFIRVDKSMSYETIFIHDCRCCVRDVERDVAWLAQYLNRRNEVTRAFSTVAGRQVISEFMKFINRLSDYLFTVARYHSHYCKFFDPTCKLRQPSAEAVVTEPQPTQDRIFESILDL